MPTWQIALVIWLVTGVTIAGTGLLVIVSIPALYDDGVRLIPWVTGISFVIALFVSWVIAKQINYKRA